MADTEVDKVFDKVADEKKEDKRGMQKREGKRVPNLVQAKKGTQFGERGMQRRRRIRKGTQCGERVGHGGWLIGPKLFQPEAEPGLRIF